MIDDHKALYETPIFNQDPMQQRVSGQPVVLSGKRAKMLALADLGNGLAIAWGRTKKNGH